MLERELQKSILKTENVREISKQRKRKEHFQSWRHISREKKILQYLKVRQVADALGDGLELVALEVTTEVNIDGRKC